MARPLFSKGGITINTGNRILSDEAEEEIRRLFSEKSGLKISGFITSAQGDDDTPATQVEPPEQEPTTESPPRRSNGTAAKSLDEYSTADLARALSEMSPQSRRSNYGAMVVRGTIRSGEKVEHAGDLIILGDTNPGSEVIADGDVVAMGVLKGLVQAGASGDNKATVIALDILSPRIRIGTTTAAAPAPNSSTRGDRRGPGSRIEQPKIAYVRDNAIHVSAFAGRFARYTKGVLYER